MTPLPLTPCETLGSSPYHLESPLDCIPNSMNMNLSKLWEVVKDREAWHATVHQVTKPSASQLLAFSPGQEQAAGMGELVNAPGLGKEAVGEGLPLAE